MKKTILWIFAIFLIVPIAFSETRMDTRAILLNSTTIYRLQQFIWYENTRLTSIVGNEPLSFYVDYRCDAFGNLNLAEFNAQYPSKNITNVTLKFVYNPVDYLTNGSYLFMDSMNSSIDLTNMIPFPSRKEFFRLNPKETLFIILDTQFNTEPIMDSPCTFSVVLGTHGCDKCRELDYYKFVQDVNEANIIKSYNDRIKSRIQSFFTYQYEFALILFYVVLIAMFIIVVTIVMYCLMWVYHYIQHLLE